jgi:hypothetical protein
MSPEPPHNTLQSLMVSHDVTINVTRNSLECRRQPRRGLLSVTSGEAGGLPVPSHINPASGLNPIRICVEPARGVHVVSLGEPPASPEVTQN